MSRAAPIMLSWELPSTTFFIRLKLPTLTFATYLPSQCPSAGAACSPRPIGVIKTPPSSPSALRRELDPICPYPAELVHAALESSPEGQPRYVDLRAPVGVQREDADEGHDDGGEAGAEGNAGANFLEEVHLVRGQDRRGVKPYLGVMHWPARNKPRDDGNDIYDHGEYENPVPNPSVDGPHALYQPPEHEQQADLDTPQRRPKHDIGGENAQQHLRVLLREVWRPLCLALRDALEGVDLGENGEVKARVGEVENERRPAEVVVEAEAVGSLPAHDDASEDEGGGNDHAGNDGARVRRASDVAAARGGHHGWNDRAGALPVVSSTGRCE
ncbi:hypothetical protein V501_10109 [Pseudogymnoascus sp. VKM F-4519 (FW-2642)]|nr:hypothetical protein V501_10109 [Pseudogymnoascus sp. VKM F-4519 (FW-2642)]